MTARQKKVKLQLHCRNVLEMCCWRFIVISKPNESYRTIKKTDSNQISGQVIKHFLEIHLNTQLLLSKNLKYQVGEVCLDRQMIIYRQTFLHSTEDPEKLFLWIQNKTFILSHLVWPTAPDPHIWNYETMRRSKSLGREPTTWKS